MLGATGLFVLFSLGILKSDYGLCLNYTSLRKGGTGQNNLTAVLPGNGIFFGCIAQGSCIPWDVNMQGGWFSGAPAVVREWRVQTRLLSLLPANL